MLRSKRIILCTYRTSPLMSAPVFLMILISNYFVFHRRKLVTPLYAIDEYRLTFNLDIFSNTLYIGKNSSK